MGRLTLDQIAAMDSEALTPAQVAAVLQMDADAIRWQARQEPQKLGFPSICVGSRVKFPKAAFLRFMRGE